ncbi:MAG TPA: restriction endonuclease subunit S [Chitinophagaceae bacterium]|nr:restriction endonuclease subunit S [Chitinophagaceae bacterium]
MSEWTTYRLGDVSEKIGSGATPRGGKEAYLEFGEISLIRSQNVLDFSFSKNGLAYISEEQAHDLRNVIVEEDDVLLNITGDSVARVCQVPLEILPARVNQHVSIIRGKKEILNQSFLKYYLLEPSFKRYMLGLASAGATRNALTKVMIENFEIVAPELEEQQEIASILSSLDDKIELNLQMNQTLEAMAQAIFKEWFVPSTSSGQRTFNFPGFDGELVDVVNADQSVSSLPKGWKIGKLGEILELLYGKALKADTRIAGEYPVIGSSGIVDYHNEYLVEAPGIVIGRKGTIGEVIWIDENFFPIDTTFYVNDLLGAGGLYFHYFLLKDQEFKKIASDSAVPGLNRNQAMNNLVKIPDVRVIHDFNSIVQPFFLKRKENIDQIKNLTQIRDSLLPKLMTGKISLNTI